MKEVKFKPGDRFVIEIAGVMKEIGGERCVTDELSGGIHPMFTTYRIKGFNSLVFDEAGLKKLLPYSETVRDSNRKAYDNGAKDGYDRRDAELKEQTELIDELRQSEYRRGLKDAWEAVRRIETLPQDGGLTNEEIAKVFGRYLPAYQLYNIYSVERAISLLNTFDEEQKAIAEADADVHVGDVLRSTLSNRKDFTVLVTGVCNGDWYVVQEDGITAEIRGNSKQFWEKTGVNVNVEDVLKLIKESSRE